MKSRICIKKKANLAFEKQTFSTVVQIICGFLFKMMFSFALSNFLTFLGGDEYLLIYEL